MAETVGELQEAAGRYGFFWPPDPTSAAVCTIGGNLAYNSAGPRAVKYGTPRENTLGLRAVTGGGDLLDELQRHVRLVELKIEPDAPAAGKTLRQLDLRRATGATVLAVRRDAAVDANPSPDTVLGAGGLLNVGEAVLRGDLVVTDTESDTYAQLVANWSYSWTWRGRNMSGALEYHFNGFGQDDGRRDDPLPTRA